MKTLLKFISIGLIFLMCSCQREVLNCTVIWADNTTQNYNEEMFQGVHPCDLYSESQLVVNCYCE